MAKSIQVWDGSTWQSVAPLLPTVTSQFIQLTNPSSTGYIIRAAASQTANIFQIQNYSVTPLVTVDSTGNVAINRSSANVRSAPSGQYLTLGGSGPAGGVVELVNTSSDSAANYSTIVFGADGNTLASNKSISQIDVFTSGTTANNRGGTMIFSTKADGGSILERLRIDNTGAITSTGTLSIGATTVNGNLTVTGTMTVSGFTGTFTNPYLIYSVNSQTGTSYTSVLSDATGIVLMNNSSANTFNIPTNASVAYAVGASLTVIQTGTGTTTIQAVTSGTTTIASNATTSTAPRLRAQYSSATIIKVATDTWYVVGDIA